MGKVRKFELDDIEQVIDLNIKSFANSKNLPREVQYEIFSEICFKNPWFSDEVRSLVYEEPNGKIKGFLAVIPRRFYFEGQEILVGVAQHLMVDQVPLASLQLFREFFSGPQELSITDMAVDIGKPLWERLGGHTIYLHSIYWRKPIRPLSFILSMSSAKNNILLKSISNLLDGVVSPLYCAGYKKLKFILSELNENDFLKNIEQFTNNKTLIPIYTLESIKWLFERLNIEKRFGVFKKIKVSDNEGNFLGWFLLNILNKGTSNVIQILSNEKNIIDVLKSLFYYAYNNGTTELVGRLDPTFMKVFFEQKCLFMPGRNWMLAHSKNKEIINALNSNNAFFTRLEGDLWFF